MDLEMTGLDPTRNVIVEIATLVTDDNLEIVAEGPDPVVHQPREALDAMVDVVRDMHTRSGLLPAIQASRDLAGEGGPPRSTSSAPTCRSAHGPAVRQLDRHRSPLPGRLPAGHRELPALPVGRRVHHQGAGPALGARRRRSRARKETTHRALDDIRESVNELRWYREHLFRIEAVDGSGTA